MDNLDFANDLLPEIAELSSSYDTSPERINAYFAQVFQARVVSSYLGTYSPLTAKSVARYKSQIFSELKGKALKILEVGIGTGPNLSYYASDSDLQVVGIDPNPKMEKYDQSPVAGCINWPATLKF